MVGDGDWPRAFVAVCAVGFWGALGRVGEVMYEVDYVCVEFLGDYVSKEGSRELFRVVLGVCEGGTAALVCGGEVDEEHV